MLLSYYLYLFLIFLIHALALTLSPLMQCIVMHFRKSEQNIETSLRDWTFCSFFVACYFLLLAWYSFAWYYSYLVSCYFFLGACHCLLVASYFFASCSLLSTKCCSPEWDRKILYINPKNSCPNSYLFLFDPVCVKWGLFSFPKVSKLFSIKL